jgi:hypothetical protein
MTIEERCGACGQLLTPEARQFMLSDAEEIESPDDEFFDSYDDDEDSHIMGERRCDYVDPRWTTTESERRRGEDMELNQCAKCARYFVQDVPLRLFQEMSGGIVLGMAVCEKCAPDVVRQMHAPASQS